MYRYSIIIPVYKIDLESLRLCLESIYLQTYRNYEVIIICDGSPDYIIEFCQQYTVDKPNTKLIIQENHGVSSARNSGIQNSVGDKLLFVDSDDLIGNRLLEMVENHLKKESKELLFFGYCKSNKLKVLNTSETKYKKHSTDEIINSLISREQISPLFNFGSVWGCVFDRSIIINNNIRFNENLVRSEDRIFLLNYISQTTNIGYIGYIGYCYTIENAFSSSSTFNPRLLDSSLAIIKEVRMLPYQISEESYTKFIINNIIDLINLYYFHPNSELKGLVGLNSFSKFVSSDENQKAISRVKLRKEEYSLRTLITLRLLKLRMSLIAGVLNKIYLSADCYKEKGNVVNE